VDQQTFQAVDDFVQSTVAAQDDVLNEALADAARAGMPAIQVSAAQGKLLQLLAQAVGARTVLEVGTLAGYSTIWLGRALPAGGRLITLEYEPLHAEVARGTSSAPASPSWSTCGSGRRWTRSGRWRARAPGPSTSPSSTPTRSTPPPTSSGPWSARGPGR